MKDNIRSSAVCKTWCEIAASLRVGDRLLWLIYLDPCYFRSVSYGFYEPLEKKKTKAMSLPQFTVDACIVCSNDGWLLTRDVSRHVNLFFFNPFTRKRKNLPKFEGFVAEYAFSCAPTKRDCLVFGIHNSFSDLSVTISTWRRGVTTWVVEDFPNPFPCSFKNTKNVLYSDGLLCTSSEIALGVFDPSAHTWNVLPLQPIPIPNVMTHIFDVQVIPIITLVIRLLRWMTEYKGEIYLVDATLIEPTVFRLNRLESVWEKKETLDGSSIFVSDQSCVMTSGLTESMSNILYVWNNLPQGKYPAT